MFHLGKEVVAYVDEKSQPHPAIRHSRCELLMKTLGESRSKRCSQCESHRKVLHILFNRQEKRGEDGRTAHDSHANYRYLNTPEKVLRLREMRSVQRSTQSQLDRLRAQLDKVIQKKGVQVHDELHADLQQIMAESEEEIATLPSENAFQKIFFEQQKKAASLKNSRSMRWHPLMIKWCLYLKHLSSKAYETLRESGCINLPSQRTLRDYTHCVNSTCGFSKEIDAQLISAAKLDQLQEFEKCVSLIMDEMYIKEDLVYNKHSGAVVGFANLGDTNTHLLQFESIVAGGGEARTLAKTMFVLMVRGLFIRLQFPYAQFPCSVLSGDLLYDIVWEAVYRLERVGLKVLALTADGASMNRLFFRLHHPESPRNEVTYKVCNPHSPDARSLYFFSDAPHLIKTVRNAFKSDKRLLWVRLL